MEHSRLNGKDIWTVSKNGVRSQAEKLDWNWNDENSIDMINQWYDEKHDQVTEGKGITGHYESIISSRYYYVGLDWFNTICAQYPSCLAGHYTIDGLKEDFIDEKSNIIKILDIQQNKIKSYYLDGHKEMKTEETQVLFPRVKTSVSNISLWFLKKYELIYQSNNNNMAKVNNNGKITALKAGNPTITCKREDKKNFYATFNIVIKCNHEKNLIKKI